MTSIEDIFEKGIEFHHYTNTAYPLDGRKVWKDLKVKEEHVDDTIRSEWASVDKLGLYAHIPFCKARCNYCEYTVLSGDETELKEEYVGLLLKEIKTYNKILSGKKAVGLDLGGGTPSILAVESIGRIIDSIIERYVLDDGFGISIETTPEIASLDYDKIKGLKDLGIDRISMGMQTIDEKLLDHFGRGGNTVSVLKKAAENIRKAGFEKLNIDLMYGFADQSIESFMRTMDFAVHLDPEYITLYRNRYKHTKLEKEAITMGLNRINEQYNLAWQHLTGNGFDANLGKNTFSRVKGDPGTSAYLTRRVVDGVPYLGMGLGAQSFSKDALYYNQGASTKRMGKYKELIEQGRFPVQDLYLLPTDESIAKMICVSFYFGYINKTSFKDRFGNGLEDVFADEMGFLEEKGLMVHDGDLFMLTDAGKNAINGIIPLFYSERSKKNLMNYGVKQDV